MTRTLLIIILVFTTFFSGYAQDPQLFEQDWYLYELVIDGESHLPPSNDEVEYVSLDVVEDFLTTFVCTSIGGTIATINNDFFTTEEFVILGEPCAIQENNEYESLYYNGFFNWQEVDKSFDYEITESDDTFTLTLTNEMGDTAMYGNEPLSTQEHEIVTATIFPNPVENQLHITSNHQITHIALYDITGKLVLEQKGNVNTLDFSVVPPTVYFLYLDTNQGSTVRKIVKK